MTAAGLKRLRWRCRRGMRELDVLLATYLEQRAALMNDGEQALFEHLLEQTDMDLYDWFTRRSRPSEAGFAALVEDILAAGTAPPAASR